MRTGDGRVSVGGHPAARGEGPIGQAVTAYRDAVAAGRVDPQRDGAIIERLMPLWTKAEAALLTNARASTRAGRGPGGWPAARSSRQEPVPPRPVPDIGRGGVEVAALLAATAEVVVRALDHVHLLASAGQRCVEVPQVACRAGVIG